MGYISTVSTELRLAHFAEDPELAIVVTLGTEHWSYGQTTLTVHGSGAVAVDNRRAGRHQQYTGQLDPGELAAFGEQMAKLGLTGLSSRRKTYEMGEATLTIELREGDTVLHHADLPVDDRFSDDGLDLLVRAYDALVNRFTDGALPYGPAVAE